MKDTPFTPGQNELFDRYSNRVWDTRRKYFFEKLGESDRLNINSVLNVLEWIREDVVYFAVWSLNVLLTIRAYGKIIRREYGLSYTRQWIRLMYVKFILRKETQHFRTRLLFKEENWKRVNDFILAHCSVQLEFLRGTTADEKVLINDKFLFYNYCKSINIPTPEILAVYENGEVIFQQSSNYLQNCSLFIKSRSGGKGKAARKFTFHEGMYSDNQNNSYSAESLDSYLKSVSIEKGPIILQPALKNHKSWGNFTPGSLATCRLVTARTPDTDDIIPLFCAFKMPVGNSDADNYSLGGLIAPVHLETGRLGMAVTSVPVDGRFEFSVHPSTNYRFDGQILPHWKELLNFTLKSHWHFKTIFVGWDVSVTTDGCQMIEGNITWASGSYEIPFQDSLKNTLYPELFERWMDTISN